jgi:hypothetical protein
MGCGSGWCLSWTHGWRVSVRMKISCPCWLDRRHWLHVGWFEWRCGGVLRQVGSGWRLELQHLPHPGGVAALSGMPQAEVTDLVEAPRQHVLEEAAYELLAAETTGSRTAGLA